MLRAIIFDLDDTLYPERAFVESGFRAVADWVARRLGLSPEAVHQELMSSFENGVRGDAFDRLLADKGVKEEGWVRLMLGVYRGHTPSIEPYPLVPELLRRLHARCLLGLVTDGYGTLQRRKIRALGLEGTFDAAVVTGDLGTRAWKPSPRPFTTVLDQLGVAAEDAVYVADNPVKDFLGANRIGMGTIRIRHPEGLYAGLEPPWRRYAPDAEVTTFDDLEVLVTSWHETSQAASAWRA